VIFVFLDLFFSVLFLVLICLVFEFLGAPLFFIDDLVFVEVRLAVFGLAFFLVEVFLVIFRIMICSRFSVIVLMRYGLRFNPFWPFPEIKEYT